MFFIKRPRVMFRNTVLVFCFVASIVFNSKAQSYVVSGKVVSSVENAQVEFATIKLLNVQDSSLYRAMYADSSGAFLFDEIDCNKSFVLKVAHIGYESLYRDSKALGNCDNIDFGALKLKIDATLNLQEVKVKAQIDVLKAGIDKKVYNVGEDISVKGGTANDVLNRLPSVEVDEDGGVTLRGDGSVIILINGRPSSLSGGNGKTLLDALPAGSIERVEIVTNPSARYLHQLRTRWPSQHKEVAQLAILCG